MVVVGGGHDVEALFTHTVFRNTRQALYISPAFVLHGNVDAYVCGTEMRHLLMGRLRVACGVDLLLTLGMTREFSGIHGALCL